MKLTDFQRQAVSLVVLVAFVATFHFWATPTLPASTAGNSETTMKHGDNGNPKFIEHERSSTQVIKKAKKFPWLIIGVGAAAVCVVLCFLLLKGSDGSNNTNKVYRNGVLTISGVRYEMASILSGEFQMGSNDQDADEKPVHTVQISKRFWLGKTEVTQGLWQAVMGSNPSRFRKGATYPVEEISWDDCQSFIKKLNQLVGGNIFRLPTEAEWEYACRARTTGDRYGDINAIAWYKKNSADTTHPVGQLQANVWGLFDTLGNVWEWCQDWYGDYRLGYQTDPQGPSLGSDRVIRGGCWYNDAWAVRSTIRPKQSPSYRYYILGFRLAAVSAEN